MYETQAVEAGELKVFRDIDAARTWLGLADVTSPPDA